MRSILLMLVAVAGLAMTSAVPATASPLRGPSPAVTAVQYAPNWREHRRAVERERWAHWHRHEHDLWVLRHHRREEAEHWRHAHERCWGGCY